MRRRDAILWGLPLVARMGVADAVQAPVPLGDGIKVGDAQPAAPSDAVQRTRLDAAELIRTLSEKTRTNGMSKQPWRFQFTTSNGETYNIIGGPGDLTEKQRSEIQVNPSLLANSEALEVAVRAGGALVLPTDWHARASPYTVELFGAVDDLDPAKGCLAYPSRDGVVRLFYPDARADDACTGVLLAPEWVITAGHCVEKRPSSIGVGSCIGSQETYDVRVSEDGCILYERSFPSALHEYSNGVTPVCGFDDPMLDIRSMVSGRDLALLRLTRPVEPAFAPPRPLLMPKPGRCLEQTDATISGYGGVKTGRECK